MWRPLITRTYDTADESNTRKMTLRKFDFAGRATFESYPQRNIAAITDPLSGTTTSYDALGRAQQKLSDSEIGTLSSTYAYPAYTPGDPGPKKTTTDPRANQSSSYFQAFDEPREDAPLKISAPESVTVNFARDVFGKATSITRSGGGASAARSYVYDSFERLCKLIEPEIGATIQAYDNANNVIWRATGVALLGTSTCDQSSVPTERQTSFTYDTRNRLKATTFGDASPGIQRTYTPDGLMESITTPSAAWSYTYNNRRLLTRESVRITTP